MQVQVGITITLNSNWVLSFRNVRLPPTIQLIDFVYK